MTEDRRGKPGRQERIRKTARAPKGAGPAQAAPSGSASARGLHRGGDDEHKGVLGCRREACSGPQLAGRRQVSGGKGGRRMSVDRCRQRGCGTGAGSAAGPGCFLGTQPCPEEVKRLLQDRCTGTWACQGQGGCAGLAAIPGERREVSDAGPRSIRPHSTNRRSPRARPPSLPPALTAARARRPGGRTPWLPAARPSVSPSVCPPGTPIQPLAPPPPQLRRGRK